MARLTIRKHPRSNGMAKLVRRLTSRGKQETNRRTKASTSKPKNAPSRCIDRWLNSVTAFVIILACMLLGVISFPETLDSSNGLVFDISPGMQITVNFNSVDGKDASQKTVLLGEHETKVTFTKTCDRDNIWLRLVGDSMQIVDLVPEMSNPEKSLSGRFNLPIPGNYVMQIFFSGCGEETSPSVVNVTTFQAQGNTMTNSSSSDYEYPDSVWISSKNFPQIDKAIAPEYIWHDPQVPAASANLLKAGNTILSKEGTLGKDGFYDFHKLSNYELVCFVGSDSASRIRESFLQFRPMLFAHQRPFKFHIYPINFFEKPDRDWEVGKKTGFRKCKHILVSVDELKQKVSQVAYISQVTIFINHLLEAFPDETFPIWFFTVMESPISPSNCLPTSLPRATTQDHPCNLALKHLFQNSPFPSRVKLLDTTKITLPQLGYRPEDVAAAVALRVFVFVGKQVRKWRSEGQEGKKDGLVRGGKLEPNFELIPYTGWD